MTWLLIFDMDYWFKLWLSANGFWVMLKLFLIFPYLPVKWNFWHRKRLFTMINDLPTIFEVVTGSTKKQPKEKSSISNHSSNKSKSGSKGVKEIYTCFSAFVFYYYDFFHCCVGQRSLPYASKLMPSHTSFVLHSCFPGVSKSLVDFYHVFWWIYDE